MFNVTYNQPRPVRDWLFPRTVATRSYVIAGASLIAAAKLSLGCTTLFREYVHASAIPKRELAYGRQGRPHPRAKLSPIARLGLLIAPDIVRRSGTTPRAKLAWRSPQAAKSAGDGWERGAGAGGASQRRSRPQAWTPQGLHGMSSPASLASQAALRLLVGHAGWGKPRACAG